jgi:hypothetical protein
MAKATTTSDPKLGRNAAEPPALQPSYGADIPAPRNFPRGGVTALGWLAGSGDTCLCRNISGDFSGKKE